MDILVNSQFLAQELTLLNRIVPSKATMPILSNVLLHAHDNKLTMRATDLEIGVETQCDAFVQQEGSITVNAKTLADMVNQFPDAEVRLVKQNHFLLVSSDAFDSRLQTMPADDFPSIPDVSGTETTLSAATLKLLVSRTRYAISEKAQKYVLNGALLTLVETTAALVATDGKRLSIATAGRPRSESQSVIIPSKTLDVLATDMLDNDVQFSIGERHIFFKSDTRVLFSRMLDGQFPKYDKVIPRDNNKKVTVNRSTLAAALRRVGLVTNETHAVNFSFENNLLSLAARSADIGDAREQLNIVYNDADAVTVAVNVAHVLDFLAAASGQSIEIAFKNATTPLLFTDGTDYLNVIMAMRNN